MKINFKGLVDLHFLPKSEPLLPLFEAVINSIQSIEQKQIANGKITVTIKRSDQTTLSDEWKTDIEDITIQDNGIGFNSENFESFNTYATDFKKMLGCKGVGRMIWLKAFNYVAIDSYYEENGKWKHRKFDFNKENAVFNASEKEIDSQSESKTIVKLIGLQHNKKHTPKKVQTIAREILNHCFVYYVFDIAPQIVVTDGITSVSVTDLYKEVDKNNISQCEFTIKDRSFKIIQFKNYNPDSGSHCLNLCAHKRKVISINMQDAFGDIDRKFSTDNEAFTYNGYIASDYLDENVNLERSSFNIEQTESNLLYGISLKEIVDKAKEEALLFLKDDLKVFKDRKKELISQFVYSQHPRYRLLIEKYPQCIDEIRFYEDDSQLELELFKQEQKYKLKLKEEGKKIEDEIKNNSDRRTIAKKAAEYAEKISEMGKSNLAEYIIQRKSVLDVLENCLKYQNEDEQKYAYEESVHQLIFPMQKTSDEIDYHLHNLWIIDEKLSYHYYLASDKKIKSMKPVQSESKNEPDITIFDSSFAFTDESEQPFKTITIVEFKRPGRLEYNDTENPIQQVINYMDDFKNGKIKTKDGLTINRNESIRFFCYILCDVTDKIKTYARQRDFKYTPDGMGFYQYLNNYNAYVEIIPYQKMIQDSKKRNKILFDKLFNQ